MKAIRTISIIAALTMMCGNAAYADVDWTSMDDATIQAEIDKARAELASRGSSITNATENVVILDVEGVVVTVKTFELIDHFSYGPAVQVNFTVENNSSKNFEAHFEKVSINGWEVETVGYVDVGAGHKAKDTFTLSLSDADISTLDEVETIEFAFRYSDENYDYHYPDPVTIRFK